MLGKTRNKTK